MITIHPILLPHISTLNLFKRFVATLLVSVAATSVIAQAPATPPVELQENAPDRHVVVKGDTLWDISGKFLKKPWRWPEIWRLNRKQIRDPHWIYPGQVIVLDRFAEGGPRLRIEGDSNGGRSVVKLSPQIRAEAREVQAIPSIAPQDIDPFLLRNTVIGAEELEKAPQIVRSAGERVIFSATDPVYAVGLQPEASDTIFQVFRKGRPLLDSTIPERKWYEWRHNAENPQIIGYEATYLGTARLLTPGEVAKLEITSTREEIQVGDVLLPMPEEQIMRYVPHALETPLDAVVMTLPSGTTEAGRTAIVTFNRGKNHGLEIGHVLAAFKPKEAFRNPRRKPSSLEWISGFPPPENPEPETLTIPEEPIGLVFVYRVFNNISYGIVMNTGKEPIKVGYVLRNP